jgi:hypothetical protein
LVLLFEAVARKVRLGIDDFKDWHKFGDPTNAQKGVVFVNPQIGVVEKYTGLVGRGKSGFT